MSDARTNSLRIGHIGRDAQPSVAMIDYPADQRAAADLKVRLAILIGDDLIGLDDRSNQVFERKAAGGGGQIGTNRAAASRDRVAIGAARLRKQSASARSIRLMLP